MNSTDSFTNTGFHETNSAKAADEKTPLSPLNGNSYNLGANAARVTAAIVELKQQSEQARDLARTILRQAKESQQKLTSQQKHILEVLQNEDQEISALHQQQKTALEAWHHNWQHRIGSLSRNLRPPTTYSPGPDAQLQRPDPALLQGASKRYAEFNKNIKKCSEAVEQLNRRLTRLGYSIDDHAPILSCKGEPDTILNYLRKQLSEHEQQIISEGKLLKRFILSPTLSVMTFIALSLGGFAVGIFIWNASKDTSLAAIAAGAIFGFALVALIIWMIEINKRQRRIAAVNNEISSVVATFNKLVPIGKKHLNPETHVANQIKNILQVEESVAEKEKREHLVAEQWRQRKDARLHALLSRQTLRITQARAALTQHQQDELESYQSRCREFEMTITGNAELELKQREAAANDRHKAIEQSIAKTLTNLIADLERANGNLRSRHRDWNDASWANWEIPAAFPVAVPCARLTSNVTDLMNEAEIPADFYRPTDLQKLELSADLVLPDAGHLLVEGAGGLAVVHQAMLRLLVGSPIGKIRFSLIDPLGLGNHFATFLRLRDTDEHIVGPKVWTSQVEIERVLSNLSYHAEKIIQKYLRDKYKTLAEYNTVAGDLAEPYQVLVIADFPHGFSDLALERLASLVQHGPRCGIFVWVHGSDSVQFPPMIKRSEFMTSGVVLQHGGSGWQVAHPPLREWDCRIEGMPETKLMHHLLNEIGKRTAQSASLAIPLSASLPDVSNRWQRNSANELRIPIGRSGADSTQSLVLGHGTAQHVLIGGRTGSGKSTLLHAIICAGAWYFAPDQLEFFLIDFKKGVEFKVYGSTQLPHARVVAVESDREFGLSVLRALDKELDDRGRRFRAVGAQDLASYREAKPSERMPRTLLIIDEFQELFVEDDAIAHGAAMLLDRFVRQGRAFGIHVILGSQSLGGSSALARSTIGQIGVRIALQCSEVDSQLILSDANLVAQLLERPGEAIYNDRSGQKEGNSPFQVFYLDDNEQRKLITDLPRDPQLIPRVFEGSAPAHVRDNQELNQLIASSATIAQPKLWLGEPNTLGGPCHVTFGAGASGNLAVIGHHREASMSMVIAAICALAASKDPQSIRMRIIDGEGTDDRVSSVLHQLATELPHDITFINPGNAAEQITALHNECADGGRATLPTVLFVLGLQRVRDIRMSDDFSFSGKRGPGETFADLLAHGPDAGINTWIWCDSVGNLSRVLNRSAQRHLGQRVAFQMSAGDSSDLIDDGAASHLGLYHALFVDLSGGSRMKFRPYSAPTSSEMDDIIGAINKKWQ